MSLSGSINDSIAKCRDMMRNLLTEFIVPSRTLEKMSAKELLDRTQPRVEELTSNLEEIGSSVLLIRPEAAPILTKCLVSVDRKFNSYFELLKQDSVNPVENTRLGLEQLRQAVADVSEFLSHSEEASKSPDQTISFVLDVVERSKRDLSGEVTELGEKLEQVTKENQYMRQRLEETEYLVSTLRSEKAALEKELAQFSAQAQMADEELKKWKKEALQNSVKSIEELITQLRNQVESLRTENERLRLMVRLERARYFTMSQQQASETPQT